MKSKRSKYDVVIIGGGISGLMAAHRLSTQRPSLKIVLVEKGAALSDRHCPLVSKQSTTCAHCKYCAIMEGIAGAGAFSDGKYVISTEYGGWLTDFLDAETVISYIEQADALLVDFGATTERYVPDNALKKLCLTHDLHMQQAALKHLGTDANFDTMKKMIADIAGRVEILTHTEVTDVDTHTHTVHTQDGTFTADAILFAVGRVGSRKFAHWCKSNGIQMTNNQVDIGVRIELPAIVWDHFSQKIYEPKIWYRSKLYGDVTRMFCFNERGNVVMENTDARADRQRTFV